MFLACWFVYSHTFIPGAPIIHIPSNFQAATMSSPFSINPLMTTCNIPAAGFTQFSMVTIQRVRSKTLRKSLWRVHLKVWRIDLTFLMEFEFICIIRYFIHPFVSFLLLIEQISSGASSVNQYLEIYVLIKFKGPEDPVNSSAYEILPAIYVCLMKLVYFHGTRNSVFIFL